MRKYNFMRCFTGMFFSVLLVCSVGVFAGCSSQSTSAVTDEQTQVRQYMASVNQVAGTLSEELEKFEEALSGSDTSNVQIQIDNALRATNNAADDLAELEVPDGYSDVQDNYVEGCSLLNEAVHDYADLYGEIANATDEFPFDYSTYEQRISDIQNLYNDGIDRLEEADRLAAEL